MSLAGGGAVSAAAGAPAADLVCWRRVYDRPREQHISDRDLPQRRTAACVRRCGRRYGEDVADPAAHESVGEFATEGLTAAEWLAASCGRIGSVLLRSVLIGLAWMQHHRLMDKVERTDGVCCTDR